MLMKMMNIFKKRKILVTHPGGFHSDDLFATAVLDILLDGHVKIIRTRDSEIIKKGDFIYDVGGIYDPDKNRFDHHQKEGSGQRENGIPYASFGLVWKKYGEQICGSKEVADRIDRKLVQPIDASDNGFDISKPLISGITRRGVDKLFLDQAPTWKEERKNIDKIFIKQSKEVKKFLLREIKISKDEEEGCQIILERYKNASDKRIIIFDISLPRNLYQDTLAMLPEPIYVIMPTGSERSWKIEAIIKSVGTKESRKPFPESWRGLTNKDEKLKEVTGVLDVIFCHKSGFTMQTVSKESAVALAEKALIA